MGPLALLTLVAVVSLAVLAVLSVSTANATLARAERRATATTELYQDEAAANVFLAELEAQLAADVSDGPAISAAQEAAASEADGAVEVTTSRDGDACHATFDCGNGRMLSITVIIGNDGSVRVQEWRVTTVQNDEPTMGELLGSS